MLLVEKVLALNCDFGFNSISYKLLFEMSKIEMV